MGIFDSYFLGTDVLGSVDTDDFEVLGASSSGNISSVQTAAQRAQAAAAKLMKLKPAVAKKLASTATTMLASATKKAAAASTATPGASSSAASPALAAAIAANQPLKNTINSALNALAPRPISTSIPTRAPSVVPNLVRPSISTPTKTPSIPARTTSAAPQMATVRPAAARLISAVRGVVGALPPGFVDMAVANPMFEQLIDSLGATEQALNALAEAGEDLSGLLNIVNQLASVNMAAGGTYQSQCDAGNAIVTTLSGLISGWDGSLGDGGLSVYQSEVAQLVSAVNNASSQSTAWQSSVAGIIASNPTAAATAASTGTAWAPNTYYALGQQVTSGANLYRCIVAGTTGSVAPTATSGNIVDGSATWSYAGASGSVNVTASAQWLPNTYYTVGQQVTNAGFNYSCAVAGTSGAYGPTAQSTVQDGSVTWTYTGISTTASAASQGPWTPETYYSVGVVVSNQGSLYRCVVGGMSGQTGPYGTAGTVQDGTCSWTYAGVDPNAMYDQSMAAQEADGGGDDGGDDGDDADFGDDDSDDGDDDGDDDSDDGDPDGGSDDSDQEFDDVPSSDLSPDDPNAEMDADDGGDDSDDDSDDSDDDDSDDDSDGDSDDGSSSYGGGYSPAPGPGAYVSPNLPSINIPWQPINFTTVAPAPSVAITPDASAPTDVSGSLMGRARHHRHATVSGMRNGRGHKRDAVHGDDGGFTLPSILPNVSDASWTQFVVAIRGDAGVGDVSDANAMGMFQMRPRRLSDLGLIQNVSSTRAPNGKMLWVGNFVAPLTARKFLSDPALQYKTFCASMKKYVAGMKDGSVPTPDGGRPSDMSLSGALAVLHRCGPSGIKTWNDVDNRFSDTEDLYNATNGIF